MDECDLTINEKAEFDKLCLVVDDGLKSFLAVGSALFEIKGKRLYRQTHTNFDDFVREKWGISRDRADQLIKAAEVKSEMPTNGRNSEIASSIENERQLRELSRLGTEDIPEALDKIKEFCEESGKKPTAKVIKSVVDEMLGKAEPEPVKPEPSREDSLEREQRHIDLARKHLSGLRLALSNLGAGNRFDEYWTNVEEWING